MAKFIFRLQSFLGLKEKIEEQKKLEYGKALKQLEDERGKKKQLEIESTNYMNNFRQKSKSGISPFEFRQFDQYLVFLDNCIANQEIAIKKCEEFVENKRVELVEAVKERKMLETLKEKDFLNYLEEEKQQEQKIVDEIVSFQYNNR